MAEIHTVTAATVDDAMDRLAERHPPVQLAEGDEVRVIYPDRSEKIFMVTEVDRDTGRYRLQHR